MSEIRFPVVAGAGIRGPIKSNIKMTAFNLGLDCRVEEDKGFLRSTYYFTVAGDAASLRLFQTTIEDYFHRMDELDAARQSP